MSSMPRELRAKLRDNRIRARKNNPAPAQILPLPVDRTLDRKGQPEINNGSILPPGLPPASKIFPIGSGKPLF